MENMLTAMENYANCKLEQEIISVYWQSDTIFNKKLRPRTTIQYYLIPAK